MEYDEKTVACNGKGMASKHGWVGAKGGMAFFCKNGDDSGYSIRCLIINSSAHFMNVHFNILYLPVCTVTRFILGLGLFIF